MTNKTKRFLFFTGGTDSTLLLHYMLELLKANPKDELVITILSNGGISSGKEEKVINALYCASAQILGKELHNTQDVMNRISVAIVDLTLHEQQTFRITASDENGREHAITLRQAKGDENVLKNISYLSMQEVTLMSALPILTRFLGECKNTFYIGACGTDLATQCVDKLSQLVDLFYEIAMFRDLGSELNQELIKAGIDTHSRTPDSIKFKKEWIPTLEMPLRHMRKQDVILVLTSLELTHYDVDKVENLSEHYCMDLTSGLDLPAKYISTYHKIKLECGHPKDFPSVLSFIKTGKLAWNGTEYPQEKINQHFENFIVEQIMRASKMPREIAIMMAKQQIAMEK